MKPQALILSLLLLLNYNARTQPFFFEIDEAIYDDNDTNYWFNPSFDMLGINIGKKHVKLDFIGLIKKGYPCFITFKKEESFYQNNRYYFHFYDKWGYDNYELIFYENFEKAVLKFDWDKTIETYKIVVTLSRNRDFLKTQKDDFKVLPRYLKKQLKLQAKIESGMV